MDTLILGIDIGGTKIAAGLVTPGGDLLTRQEVPTEQEKGFSHSSGQMFRVLEAMLRRAGEERSQVIGIGACAPGPINPGSGVLVNPPNLLGWSNLALRDLLRERYELPVCLDNDANAAGLAEALWGTGAGFDLVFYVTVSTGIGTGIVQRRKILHGKNGMAAEGGHVSIQAFDETYRCNCGNIGCIEAYASGPSTARRAMRKLEHLDPKPPILEQEVQGHWQGLTMRHIGQAAAKGDPFALEVVRETGAFLGIWLGGVVSLLDPDIIVIGGGVAQTGEPLFRAIREELPKRTINRLAAQTPVVRAGLQRDVGIYGAASLLMPGLDP